MTTHRVVALDALRGVAVIAVVLFHLEVAAGGFMGVDVFFVMSGFLITGIVLREQRLTGTVVLRRFYVRRALRLYPALVVLVVSCLVLALSAGRAVRETLSDAVAALLYVSNLADLDGGLLGHTWTLALEEQFYLVWPAVLLLVLTVRWRRAGWAAAGGVVTVVLVLDLAGGTDGAMHTYVRAMGLPLGCALALGRDTAVFRTLARTGPLAAVLVCAAFVIPLPSWATTGWPVSTGALLAIPVVASAASLEPRWLSSRVLVWFGERSYSLYLWHFPLLSLAGNNAPAVVPHWVALSGGVALSLVAAEISYRFVEKPVLTWRDLPTMRRRAAWIG